LAAAFSTGVFWGYYRTPEADRDSASVNQSIALCSELMQIVEGVLEARPFLAGEHFSLGDIPLGTWLFRYFGLDIDRPPLPRVEAWYSRLALRAAYSEHVMVPYDDLKGRLAF
jgi:glutathione S-transferase